MAANLGRRMSDVARYNAEAGIMQVRFASGGRGTPNTYAYSSIDAETWDNFMAGRWSENGTATHWFLTPGAGCGSNPLMPRQPTFAVSRTTTEIHEIHPPQPRLTCSVVYLNRICMGRRCLEAWKVEQPRRSPPRA